jgi:hypothetical protein
MAILQFEILSGVGKGLTRTADALLTLEENPEVEAELEKIKVAREDLRMINLRDGLFAAIRNAVDLWSSDAGVGHVCSYFAPVCMTRIKLIQSLYLGYQRPIQIYHLPAIRYYTHILACRSTPGPCVSRCTTSPHRDLANAR